MNLRFNIMDISRASWGRATTNRSVAYLLLMSVNLLQETANVGIASSYLYVWPRSAFGGSNGTGRT